MFHDVSAIADALEAKGYDKLKVFLGTLNENGVINFTKWLNTQVNLDSFEITDESLDQVKLALVSHSDFIRAIRWNGGHDCSGSEINRILENESKLLFIKQIFSTNLFNLVAVITVVACFAFLFTAMLVNPEFPMTQKLCDTMVTVLFTIFGFYCGKVTLPNSKK